MDRLNHPHRLQRVRLFQNPADDCGGFVAEFAQFRHAPIRVPGRDSRQQAAGGLGVERQRGPYFLCLADDLSAL